MSQPEIVDYIRRYDEQYTEEALRAQLAAAGHPQADIDAAFAAAREVQGHPSSVSWRESANGVDFWIAFVLVVLGVILGAVFVVQFAVAYLVVYALVALVAGLLAALAAPWGTDVRRGIGAAIALIVIVPMVAIGGLYAYCLLNQLNFG